MQLNSAYQKIIEKLKIIGIIPADTIELKNTKNQLVFLAILMSFGGVMWGTILVIFGLFVPAIIPYGYVVLSFFNILFFRSSKKFGFTRSFQIVISMLLPFALQWMLGGFVSSGVTMLWATLSLIGAITLLNGKGAYKWLSLFIGLTLFSLIIEPYIAFMKPEIFTQEVSEVLLSINIIVIISIIFVLSKVKVDQDVILKKELAETNKELLISNEVLHQIQVEITSKRDLLEENNKDLKDYQQRIIRSIESAKLIQNAFLPTTESIREIFGEHFILYLPKDMVSGDFYWSHSTKNKRIFIEGDCTGHGVPGALMTVIANSILNQIVHVEQTFDPSQIMEKLHSKLELVLQQKITKNRDGMDLAIVLLEDVDETIRVTFGAANQSLYYTNKDSIIEIKGSRKRIGGIVNEKKKFENVYLTVPEKTILYLCSDGYKDQNNRIRKKFSSKQFKELLYQIKDLPLEEQKSTLLRTLLKHRVGTEQRDDITVIGLKIQSKKSLSVYDNKRDFRITNL